jgi:hypothetical protein
VVRVVIGVVEAVNGVVSVVIGVVELAVSEGVVRLVVGIALVNVGMLFGSQAGNAARMAAPPTARLALLRNSRRVSRPVGGLLLLTHLFLAAKKASPAIVQSVTIQISEKHTPPDNKYPPR